MLEADDNDAYEDVSYESLLELCDAIGYHKVGVSDIDIVAPKYDHLLLSKDWRCAICLDHSTCVRKINQCNHIFCSCCIETWFSENKTCPICKQDVDQVATLDDVD